MKPSEVVRSLLAKRSVFDEDSERLEGATRAPSPSGSPRGRPPPCVPRALRYPFPAHPPTQTSSTPSVPLPTHPSVLHPPPVDVESDPTDRPADPRLNRPERPYQLERLGKFNESDYRYESRIRLRTPSTDKPQIESIDRRQSPRGDRERPELDRDLEKEIDKRRRDSLYSSRETDCKFLLGANEQEIKEAIEKIDPDYQNRERKNSIILENVVKTVDKPEIFDSKVLVSEIVNKNEAPVEETANCTESAGINSGRIECDLKKEPDVLKLNEKKIESEKFDLNFDKQPIIFDGCSIKSDVNKTELLQHIDIPQLNTENKMDHGITEKIDGDKRKEILIQNHINKEHVDIDVHSHFNSVNIIKPTKEISELSQELIKSHDKNGKERLNPSIILEAYHNAKLEKENIEFDKTSDKDKCGHTLFSTEKKISENDNKVVEDRVKNDKEKVRHSKDRHEKDRHDHEREKLKNNKTDKEKKYKDDNSSEKLHVDKNEKTKTEKDVEKVQKDRNERDADKVKHFEDKSSRHDHHRKDKRKDSTESDLSKLKKDEKHKHDKTKKDSGETKRDTKKDPDSIKSRKSSRDETAKDLCRKDSTDSSTSRTSYDSSKFKDLEQIEIKEESKLKVKCYNDLFIKQEVVKELSPKSVDFIKIETPIKIKTEIKEEKELADNKASNSKIDYCVDNIKCKAEISEKQRHYSLDSPSLDCKRKERLNSCSSLPSNIGLKRRISSQDSIDSFNEEIKKSRSELKCPERRDSKDSRSVDRHKTTKFNKGHFAKIIESKTKDDKKNQVKPPDDTITGFKDCEIKDQKKAFKKIAHGDKDDKLILNADLQPEGLQNDLDFLATLELRSSEEDEKQKALRKEMKEKKRIQQLQQIQELQMQQDALQHAELLGKFKDEKKHKTDEKKKEAAREKRMSTDRKSREDKSDNNSKRRCRKQLNSTDSSDSDEPKKHSIFDIIDDEPTYISMYDKVKARSCKNMQKQEEEKRQEKIKAKFSQLKQSRAKREEKKRSSWDEDSDSEHDRRKSQKLSMDSSSDDGQIVMHNKKREKSRSFDYDRSKINDYFTIPSNEEDSRSKLSRKNSRTRIISDTSDDEASKRSISKSPNFLNDIRKELMSSFDLLQRTKDEDFSNNEPTSEKAKKNSLLNLFGKSDSDDSKLKSSFESNDKGSFNKMNSNDFSSESESMPSNRGSVEVRKKHKKKQKKHKFSFSDDEMKVESSDTTTLEGEYKHKQLDKIRRHSNKKEKRKDKTRDSIDADDSREPRPKHKTDKKLVNNCFDSGAESNFNNKKEGKMEDIFGPLSDESEKDVGDQNKQDISIHDYDSAANEEPKLKDKEDSKRRKDKRRKEKRPFMKEDDNSLDVDAVSKAIEARLFADSMTDDDNREKNEPFIECLGKNLQSDLDYTDEKINIETIKTTEKYSEKNKKDKEKKKKKKKNREDRQSRREHHYFNHNDGDCNLPNRSIEELCTKSMLLDIPLPNDIQKENISEKSDDRKSLPESPSLPRLTDSPPVILCVDENSDHKSKDLSPPSSPADENKMDVDYFSKKAIEVNDIPMPPPYENEVQDISEVPLPKDPTPDKTENETETFLPACKEIDDSEDAVRSISNLETEAEKPTDKIDASTLKTEKKLDEKPRAIISQEETEDAVAALLGESFGGKEDTFTNCYDEVENNTADEIEIESSTIESENIPEEDAEEMRQAVQNLNASEMEMKPDTPVSDNDLLLIDTDTEEADEAPQDAIDRLPVNVIATNKSLNGNTDLKPTVISNIGVPKEKAPPQTTSAETNETTATVKSNQHDIDVKLQLPAREPNQQLTSTATPVITSWTLTNHKLIEPHVLNIQPNQVPNRDTIENKPKHITANIVQIKAPQTQTVNASLRPIITPNRVTAPYQVLNHMIRPQVTNMQPPTIKIPDQHLLYQKSTGIVISPRMSNDHKLPSPKISPQGEGITSPRLANMTILSTSPQNLNSVGIPSPNTLQQRSPGQVTVVRMQQPPLSPIQAMHLPHVARTMVSPNRANSVLVQTQGAPIHFNRLPVTPVLAPISKQLAATNMSQQNKSIVVSSSALIHHQKIITGDCRKTDHRNIADNLNENSKIILSPTTLQHSTNPTVMAQNRLISMQNAMHTGNINSTLQLSNKVVVNNVNNLNEKRAKPMKSEQHNHLPFDPSPIIHVASMNQTTASIIQSGSKPVMCTLQEANSISREQGSNVIHTLNSQRLLTTPPIPNVIQLDANKGPSVLSMATIRSPTVLTKVESSNSVSVTTTSLTNVVMTPLLLKTNNTSSNIRLRTKSESDHIDNPSSKLQNHIPHHDDKLEAKKDSVKISTIFETLDKLKDMEIKTINPPEHVAKCETDFEELLKDKTNEIKVTNNPEKKLEVNVGKNVTLFGANFQSPERKLSVDSLFCKKEIQTEGVSVPEKSEVHSAEDSEKRGSPLISKYVKDSLEPPKEREIVKSDSEPIVKKDIVPEKDPLADSVINETAEFASNTKNETKFLDMVLHPSDIDDNQIKSLDENDSWSAKDVNIESVIKKVDSLCNDNMDNDTKDDESIKENTLETPVNTSDDNSTAEKERPKPMEIQENDIGSNPTEESTEKIATISKRGGRSVRGKKTEKNQDRVQTRQIAKPGRGATSAKRGRGRAKVDKKIKSLVSHSANNMPGDVYDFHEDSGDETSTSPNKTETRPRLILTIKSPLSGQSTAIATSTLSITPKDQPKNHDKVKDEKLEDFASPSANTRKSRRLQEKDGQRNTVDDVIEDVIKGSNIQSKTGKETSKKRQTRQTGTKVNQTDKATGLDTRKSPRGVKRTRDRSLSDASIDSSDEKVVKRDDALKEMKVPKLTELPIAPKLEPDPPQPAKTTPAIVSNPSPAPTPIMKPPKKMISEISAKLASAFEAAATATPVRAQLPVERIPLEADKQPQLLREPRNTEFASSAPVTSELMKAATGDLRGEK